MSTIVSLPFTENYSLATVRNMVGKNVFNIVNCSEAWGILGKCLNFNGSNSYVQGEIPITPEMSFTF
jgi:hypothetical protein